MSKDHLGYPSGVNKSERTGNSASKDDDKNKETTDKYSKGEDEVADNVRQRYPNMNTDKKDATNAGGYKE